MCKRHTGNYSITMRQGSLLYISVGQSYFGKFSIRSRNSNEGRYDVDVHIYIHMPHKTSCRPKFHQASAMFQVLNHSMLLHKHPVMYLMLSMLPLTPGPKAPPNASNAQRIYTIHVSLWIQASQYTFYLKVQPQPLGHSSRRAPVRSALPRPRLSSY